MNTKIKSAAYYNKRFWESGDDSVRESIENTLSLHTNREVIENRIDAAINEFKRKNSNFLPRTGDTMLFFAELPLGREALLSELFIDKTLQRYVYWEKILEIIRDYKGVNVQAIKVYRNKDGNLICWDGQHTLIALYIIIIRILKLKAMNVMIPIVISSGDQRAEMRRTSLGENGGFKNVFDGFDIFESLVYGALQDGMTDPDNLAAKEKQQYLETYNLFLSSERMNSNSVAGAITRSEELMNPNYVPLITKYFAQWCYDLNGSNRPFKGAELKIIYQFFDKCHNNEDITVDDDYVHKVAIACRGVLGDDYDGQEVWTNMVDSFERHYVDKAKAEWDGKTEETKPHYINNDGSINKTYTRHNDTRIMNYFCQSLAFHDIQVPTHEREWIVTEEEGF